MKPVKHLYEMYKDVKALLTANETKADDKADPQVARDNNFSTSRFCLISDVLSECIYGEAICGNRQQRCRGRIRLRSERARALASEVKSNSFGAVI
jgi:hypothetical protein